MEMEFNESLNKLSIQCRKLESFGLKTGIMGFISIVLFFVYCALAYHGSELSYIVLGLLCLLFPLGVIGISFHFWYSRRFTIRALKRIIESEGIELKEPELPLGDYSIHKTANGNFYSVLRRKNSPEIAASPDLTLYQIYDQHLTHLICI